MVGDDDRRSDPIPRKGGCYHPHHRHSTAQKRTTGYHDWHDDVLPLSQRSLLQECFYRRTLWLVDDGIGGGKSGDNNGEGGGGGGVCGGLGGEEGGVFSYGREERQLSLDFEDYYDYCCWYDGEMCYREGIGEGSVRNRPNACDNGGDRADHRFKEEEDASYHSQHFGDSYDDVDGEEGEGDTYTILNGVIGVDPSHLASEVYSILDIALPLSKSTLSSTSFSSGKRRRRRNRPSLLSNNTTTASTSSPSVSFEQQQHKSSSLVSSVLSSDGLVGMNEGTQCRVHLFPNGILIVLEEEAATTMTTTTPTSTTTTTFVQEEEVEETVEGIGKHRIILMACILTGASVVEPLVLDGAFHIRMNGLMNLYSLARNDDEGVKATTIVTSIGQRRRRPCLSLLLIASFVLAEKKVELMVVRVVD